ncbi:Uncharacterized protein Rs2_03467 [Raphanus sativus]|nr:Uncharacterized protein Rs2_03467 [Raphanus sativus]
MMQLKKSPPRDARHRPRALSLLRITKTTSSLSSPIDSDLELSHLFVLELRPLFELQPNPYRAFSSPPQTTPLELPRLFHRRIWSSLHFQRISSSLSTSLKLSTLSPSPTHIELSISLKLSISVSSSPKLLSFKLSQASLTQALPSSLCFWKHIHNTYGSLPKPPAAAPLYRALGDLFQSQRMLFPHNLPFALSSQAHTLQLSLSSPTPLQVYGLKLSQASLPQALPSSLLKMAKDVVWNCC